MKIVVTGGAGFIGSALIWKLNALGIDDIVLVDEGSALEGSLNLKGKKFSEYIEKDKFLELMEARKFKRVDAILHMGACTSTTELDASYLIENNYLYTKSLAQCSLRRGIPFLYASSAATYGDGEAGYSDADEVTMQLKPLNMYGFSKHAFDQWVIKNKLSSKVTGFKFFNVFGPNEYHKGFMRSVIAKVFDAVVAGEPMRLFKSYKKEYSDGEQKRDFIYVKDAVEVVSCFIEHPDKKGIFNVGTGKARSWNDLAYTLFAALGKAPRIEYIDMPEALRPRYQYFTQAIITKLEKADCSHVFYSLELAVKDYVDYLKNHAYL